MNYCHHCKDASGSNGEHNVVCDCGHSHSNHVFSSGCKILGCKCEGYSQVLQRTKESEMRQFKPVFQRLLEQQAKETYEQKFAQQHINDPF
jgi:hypothetical protein